MKRSHLILPAILLGLAGCQDSDSFGRSPKQQIKDLRAKVSKLEKKIALIESKYGKIDRSITKLGYEIEDFSTENWRTNVPEVEYEFEQLRQAVSEVTREY